MLWLPLAIAFQVASMVANKNGQDAVNRARRNAESANKKRTEENYQAAEKARQRSQTDVENTPENVEQAADARTDKYQSGQGGTNTNTALLSPESKGDSAVVKEDARQKTKGRQFTNSAAAARGKVDALGDVFLGTGINMNRNSADIRQMGDFSAGWTQNVLPYQLAEAGHAGDNQFMWGDLFQMAAMASAYKGIGAGGQPTQPYTNSGTFAGGQASLPTTSSGATFGGAPVDTSLGSGFGGWTSAWDQYAKQFGQGIGY